MTDETYNQGPYAQIFTEEESQPLLTLDLSSAHVQIDGVPIDQYIDQRVQALSSERNENASAHFTDSYEIDRADLVDLAHRLQPHLVPKHAVGDTPSHPTTMKLHRVKQIGPVRLEALENGCYMLHLVIDDTEAGRREGADHDVSMAVAALLRRYQQGDVSTQPSTRLEAPDQADWPSDRRPVESHRQK